MSVLASQLTLRTWYEHHFQPMYLADARPATVDQYEQCVRLWEASTKNPTLDAIDAPTMVTFRDWLRARPGRKPGELVTPETVNKHLRTLNALLAKAGPPTHHQRDAMGLLDRVPWIRELRTKNRRPKTFTIEQLDALYENCDEALHPAGLPYSPGLWWRSLIVAAYCIAVRRSALLALRWSDVDLVGRTVTVEADEDKCDSERFKPMHQVLVKHLVAIRTPDPRVFPFDRSWKCFYAAWHSIRTAAGVPESLSFHSLKKTHGTQLSRHATAWQVQQMLDHSSLKTTMKYVDGQQDLRAAVDRLTQPAAFQKELF